MFVFNVEFGPNNCQLCLAFQNQFFTGAAAELTFPYLVKHIDKWLPRVHPNCNCTLDEVESAYSSDGMLATTKDGKRTFFTDTPERAEYKRQKAAEYRAKAKAMQLNDNQELTQNPISGHYEASYKGTTFDFAPDVKTRDKIFSSYKEEIDNMSPAQIAGFKNIRITNESDTWATNVSRGQTGAAYFASKKEIVIYSADEEHTRRDVSVAEAAHWNLSHESGHGVWDESENVAWNDNDDVERARISFIDATKSEGRLTDYANAWYKSSAYRGYGENFAEATKLFTGSAAKGYIDSYPNTYAAWKSVTDLMNKVVTK